MRVIAALMLLALSVFVVSWLAQSPATARELRPVALVHDFHVGRRQYLRNLVIRRGEEVEYAICVFCSVRVEGIVERNSVALWGNVHVVPGGAAPDGVKAIGGSVTLDSGATIPYIPSIIAVGGRVRIHRALTDSVVRLMASARPGPIPAPRAKEVPGFYMPGQHTPTLEGVVAVIGGFILIALLGTVVVPPWRSALADAAVRQPWRAAALTCAVTGAVLLTVWGGLYVLYFFPPSWFLVIAILEWLWFALAVGLGTVTRWVGVLAQRVLPMPPLLLGALIIGVLLLVPVFGAALQLMLMLVSTGIGVRALTARAAPPSDPNAATP